MPLRESPFPNVFAGALHALGWGLIFPCFWFLDRLIAVCVSTTLERRRRREEECYLHPIKVFFGFLLFLFLFLVSAPFALLGFLLWAPLQWARRPFSYMQREATIKMEDRNAGWEESGKVTFGFLSVNVCLLPGGLARFNNLAHTQQRALAIGRNIVQGVSRPHIRIFIDSPSSSGALTPSSSLQNAGSASYKTTEAQTPEQDGPKNSSPNQEKIDQDPESTETSTGGVGESNHTHELQMNGGHVKPSRSSHTPLEVSALFPANVDFLCMQEVFDKRAATKLAEILSPLFGHILYDVGVYACSAGSGFKFFNSGLLVASRYPVMEAQYRCFPNSRGEDALASKGLLSLKVQTGLQKGEKKMVGFINCTHLHAPEGDGEIRCEQLDMITNWIREFQSTSREQNEVVMFDVLCGDFNFDNCSPDDDLEQKHTLFNEYTDPCRAAAGREKPQAIGTLLQQPTLYDEDVNSPDNLQRTLENEDLRKLFLAPPVPRGDTPLVYPEPGEVWVGRRIDYLLYRENSLTDHWHTEVDELTHVTQLATLTDHIPISMRLRITHTP
ncbi:sphingomyelin phosphodiesterase 5 isoform X1 [Silurus asotus]|uniref:sphingomyelin phosphodiesterase n=1 Tax=Silurus asotus TaxID=30991 RepID=A0AAD5FCP2_SILAS|nr:sphingomyelin phosphodiesterase 5 isoform X1 [Silurus asotus]